MVAFRKRSGIGFIREGTIAVELEFTEEMVGGGRGVVRFVVVVLAHGMLRRFDRDPRGLHGDESRRAARPCTRSKAEGRSTAEEDEGGLFCFAMERPEGPPENSSPQALRGRAVCWPIALSKAGARFSPTWDQPSDADDGAPAACILLAAYAASAMKRATSCGAICTRAAAWRLSRPAKRRSSLKSPRLGDTTTASSPAAFARSIRVAIAPSPAGSLSRAM